SAKSVSKGVVLLSGKAHNLTECLRAVEATSLVPGVRSVVSEIKAANEISEIKPTGSAKDSWITVETKMRLLADRSVPAMDVNVDTHGGTVTLFGIVPTEKAKAAAEHDARKVGATVLVNNELQIVPASLREQIDARDDVVERDVKTALKAHPEL